MHVMSSTTFQLASLQFATLHIFKEYKYGSLHILSCVNEAIHEELCVAKECICVVLTHLKTGRTYNLLFKVILTIKTNFDKYRKEISTLYLVPVLIYVEAKYEASFYHKCLAI